MIAQADSRKWMARLYNSFLFMEAKIMKMAKKLLAVVLTGVMAVSMLTGCAIGDAIAEDKLLDELKTWGERQETAVTYEAGKSVTVYKTAGETTTKVKEVKLSDMATKIAKKAAKLTGEATVIEGATASSDNIKDVADIGDVVFAIVEKPTNESERIAAAKKVAAKLSTTTAYSTTSNNKTKIVVSADSFSAKVTADKDAKSKDYIVVVAAAKSLTNG